MWKSVSRLLKLSLCVRSVLRRLQSICKYLTNLGFRFEKFEVEPFPIRPGYSMTHSWAPSHSYECSIEKKTQPEDGLCEDTHLFLYRWLRRTSPMACHYGWLGHPLSRFMINGNNPRPLTKSKVFARAMRAMHSGIFFWTISGGLKDHVDEHSVV